MIPDNEFTTDLEAMPSADKMFANAQKLGLAGTGAGILIEAHRLITGERQESYGHPLDSFSNIGLGWSVILGTPVTPEKVSLCMAWLKICREVNAPKRDNARDGAGYFATLEMVKEERLKRESSENDARHRPPE